MNIISEHIVHLDMVQLRCNENRKVAGKQLRAVIKYSNKMKKLGHTIEQIKPEERGYTGKGLFYGIRVFANANRS